MSQRESSKRSTTPPRPRRRTTRRGLASPIDIDYEVTQLGPPPTPDDPEEPEIEPAMSARPTRRDIVVPDAEITITRTTTRRGPRGEFSIASARGVPADVVSGSIERRTGEVAVPRRKRNSMPPVETVYLASATKREITVIVKDQTLTLARHDALALAQIIMTAFD